MTGFTLEMFKWKIKSFENDNSFQENEQDQKIDNALLAEFSPSFRAAIKEGRLRVPSSCGHVHRYGYDLTQILKGESPRYDEWFTVEYLIGRNVLFTCTYQLHDKKASTEKIEEVYNQLKQFLIDLKTNDSFDMNFWRLWGNHDCTCEVCGERFTLFPYEKGALNLSYKVFNSDKFKLGPLGVGEKREDPYEPLKECDNHPELWSHEVTFPSGVVYACDWMRLPGFTQHVDKGIENKSLNNRKDCAEISKHYALKHNFVKFQVGNSSPSVFVSPEGIWIGKELEDKYKAFANKSLKDANAEYTGYICTDLWAACLIDEKTLFEILAECNPQEPPEQAIAKWQSSDHVLKFEIEPGIYKMRHDGYAYEFDNKYAPAKNIKDFRFYGSLEKI